MLKKQVDIQLIGMLIINFMCFFIYVVPLTLVPFVTERNNVNITQTGIILSMYSLGQIFGCIFSGKYIYTYGKLIFIKIGIFLICLSLVLLGILDYLKNPLHFIFLGCLGRFIQGYGCGITCVANYSYIPQLYPDEYTQKVVYMELCIGIAAAGGVQVAILGQSVLGYSTTLYVFAIVIFILAIIVIPIFPKDNSRDDKESLDISQISLFKNLDFLILNLIICMSTTLMVFGLATIDYIPLNYKMDAQTFKLLYFMPQALQVLFIAILLYLASYINFYKAQICIGMLLQILSMVLQGQIQFFGIEHKNLTGVFIGLILNQISFQIINIPMLNLMNESTQNYFPQYNKEFIDITVTGICTVSLSIGEFAGPLLGDLLYNDYGYEKTCFIFLILFFLTFLFYLGNFLTMHQTNTNKHVELVSEY